MPGHCDSIDELTVYNQKATEFYNCNYLLDYPYLVKLWITNDVTPSPRLTILQKDIQ